MTNLWTRCNSCQRIIYKQDILDNLYVCPVCQFHFRVEAREWVEMLLDPGSYEFIDESIYPLDPLGFEDSLPYAVRLKENQEKTSLPEAVLTAVGAIGGFKVVLAVMEFNFMGGSMGSVVGEKITRAAERALADGIPLIVVSCSGGARMQEGALSLMQLIKTSSALARLDEAGIPYISILTDPTTGGVSASYGMLGDINIGEPGALIGFAGPRVIEQTIKEKLPKGFQRAEFLLQHGMLDDVVNRKNLRGYLLRIIRLLLNYYEK